MLKEYKDPAPPIRLKVGRIIHVRMGYFWFLYLAFIQSTSEMLLK